MDHIKASALTTEMLSKLSVGLPIIICSSAPRAIKKLSDAGYKEVSLNKLLSAALMEYKPEDRISKVLPELQEIIAESGESVLLTDYEMLFDPRYKLDVLKVFCDISRQTKLAVKWCGTSTNEALSYAEPRYAEYKVYDIAKYTVICVK